MARLIDADAADVERIMCYYGDNCRTEDVQEWLDDQPTIDAAPVRRGEWEKLVWEDYYDRELRSYRCSRCGKKNAVRRNYCPNCGADMRGKSE